MHDSGSAVPVTKVRTLNHNAFLLERLLTRILIEEQILGKDTH